MVNLAQHASSQGWSASYWRLRLARGASVGLLAVQGTLAALVSVGLVSDSLYASDEQIAALLLRNGVRAIEPASPAVDVRLELLEGGETALSSYSGSWLVLTFWATWCQPCVVELPTLESLSDSLPESQFAFVAVSVDSDRALVERFVNQHDLGLTVLWDRSGNAARTYRASSIPVSYVIDPSGRIRLPVASRDG